MRTWVHVALSLGFGLAAGCGLSAESDSAEVGSRSAAVVGGTPTTGYPAVPLLYSEFSAANGAQLCSGTLISPRVVLTAAHCVEFPDGPPDQYLAYFGSDVTIQSDPQRIGAINIVDHVAHPDWNIDNLQAGHDIGLVLLERAAPVAPMPFNRQPIEAHIGEQVHLVGWGRTSAEGEDYGVKREVMSSLQATSAQLMQYGTASANTCQGDSGGPNFMTINGVEVVAGITSFGNVGCDSFAFGTRVDASAGPFIDPYIAAKDPTATPGNGPGGEGEGGGSGEAPGSGTAGPEQSDSGGCSAAGGQPGQLGFTLLLLLALTAAPVWSRRRRAVDGD